MKYFKLILIIFIIHSCQGQNEKSILGTTWYEVKKNGNDYYIIDCGYNNESFKIKNDSIYDYGIMEDSSFKIYKIVENKNNLISVYINKDEKYDISWFNKEKSIIKRTGSLDGDLVKYYVNKKNLNKIEVIKGNSENCITFEDEDDYNNLTKKWQGIYYYDPFDSKDSIGSYYIDIDENKTNYGYSGGDGHFLYKSLDLIQNKDTLYIKNSSSILAKLYKKNNQFLVESNLIQDRKSKNNNTSGIFAFKYAKSASEVPDDK
ncbi:hypothetical protein [Chishuiella sp.]|uniref:hypothetical protein n=1 Tax=Chishuiella sp. TaxID=1969467 RepID=UPI0028A7B832|nr:hypothetical protein [Chishuiella sp.]